MSKTMLSWPLRYALSVLSVFGSTLIRVPLAGLLGTNIPFLFFFPAILLSGWYGGLGPGLLATGLGAVISLFFSLEPSFSFALVRPGDVLSLGLFLTVGTFISLLSSRWQQARQAERRQRDYFEVTL